MQIISLDQLSFDTFKALVRTRFLVAATPEETVELELIAAEHMGESGTGDSSRPKQETFSLIFSGTAADPLAQRTYRLTHEKIGSFDLFIVPIAAEGETIRYEAVFNRLLAPT